MSLICSFRILFTVIEACLLARAEMCYNGLTVSDWNYGIMGSLQFAPRGGKRDSRNYVVRQCTRTNLWLSLHRSTEIPRCLTMLQRRQWSSQRNIQKGIRKPDNAVTGRHNDIFFSPFDIDINQLVQEKVCLKSLHIVLHIPVGVKLLRILASRSHVPQLSDLKRYREFLFETFITAKSLTMDQ